MPDNIRFNIAIIMQRCLLFSLQLAIFGATTLNYAAASQPMQTDAIRRAVDEAIRPMMQRDGIPGLAIGVIVNGKTRVFNYGVASLKTQKPVADTTLFELGSVSKTFTATMASWAQLDRKLSLGDAVDKYLPELKGSDFGAVSLINLGTHTPGGLPLQMPDNVQSQQQLIRYLATWHALYKPGSYRTYTNIGIGTLGFITAKCMGENFTSLLQRRLFPALGLQHSYVDVPPAQMGHYAQGYTKEANPIRMQEGVLAAESYGVKSTAGDMIRFLAENMQMTLLDNRLQTAINDTHKGYFQIGDMTQDLIWEQYSYPVDESKLIAGNGPSMIVDAMPARRIYPALPPQQQVWINKTGSTNGFGSYVAFVPAQKIGIVILGNRNFPLLDRVAAAHQIMTRLSTEQRRSQSGTHAYGSREPFDIADRSTRSRNRIGQRALC